MTKIQIDKFKGSTHERSFSVPGGIVMLARRFLPRSAIADLDRRGLDIEAIAEAREKGQPYSRSLKVVERGVEKTIYVSLAR